MKRGVLLDTGLLVAVINRRDQFHSWVKTQWANIEAPLLTCEPVISEACFLLRNVYGGQEAVINLVKNGVSRSRLMNEYKKLHPLLGMEF